MLDSNLKVIMFGIITVFILSYFETEDEDEDEDSGFWSILFAEEN